MSEALVMLLSAGSTKRSRVLAISGCEAHCAEEVRVSVKHPESGRSHFPAEFFRNELNSVLVQSTVKAYIYIYICVRERQLLSGMTGVNKVTWRPARIGYMTQLISFRWASSILATM